MLFLAIGVGVLVLAWISILVKEHFKGEVNSEWEALSKQRVVVEADLKRFVRELEPEPPAACHPPCPHDKSDEFWLALSARKSDEALAIAEQAMASARNSADARLLLSMALLSTGDLEAAADQHAAAEALHGGGALAAYLGTRIEIELYLASIAEGTQKSQNGIMMPVELLALELHVRLGEAGDATALWMPGHDGEVSKEEARDFVLAHFSGYYRLLTTMLESLRQESYADGLYHLGRLALKCGFSEDGAALLLPLEEVMKDSAEARSYRRDVAILRGEKPVATEDASRGGQKRIKLNVLN